MNIAEKIENVVNTNAEITPELVKEVGDGLLEAFALNDEHHATFIIAWSKMARCIKLHVAVYNAYPAVVDAVLVAAKGWETCWHCRKNQAKPIHKSPDDGLEINWCDECTSEYGKFLNKN